MCLPSGNHTGEWLAPGKDVKHTEVLRSRSWTVVPANPDHIEWHGRGVRLSEEHGGLSPLGKQGVAWLNELGMLIDVSQLSTPAYKQVLSLTKAPEIASHSGIRALDAKSQR
jgi:Membrane dipeptidase (Peptidase family M19)